MRKVEIFPIRTTGQKKYPFEKLEIGEPYLFERGKDFTCKDSSFICAAKEWARRNGRKVLTRKEKDGVIVMVLEK